jgi:hypothetical protein
MFKPDIYIDTLINVHQNLIRTDALFGAIVVEVKIRSFRPKRIHFPDPNLSTVADPSDVHISVSIFVTSDDRMLVDQLQMKIRVVRLHPVEIRLFAAQYLAKTLFSSFTNLLLLTLTYLSIFLTPLYVTYTSFTPGKICVIIKPASWTYA